MTTPASSGKDRFSTLVGMAVATLTGLASVLTAFAVSGTLGRVFRNHPALSALGIVVTGIGIAVACYGYAVGHTRRGSGADVEPAICRRGAALLSEGAGIMLAAIIGPVVLVVVTPS